MTSYVLYDAPTGEITAWGDTTTLASVTVPDGQTLLETAAPMTRFTHYVVDGEPVAYTWPQGAVKSIVPFDGAVWDNTTMAWVRTLEQVREQAWERVKTAAENAEFGTFNWDGSEFQCDVISAARIRGAVLRSLNTSGTRSGGPWKLADNTTRTITNAQMLLLGDALEAHIEAVHAIRIAKYAEIFAETDFGVLDNIDY